MNGSAYLNWFRRLIVLGAVVAGVSVTAATAGAYRPAESQDKATQIVPTNVNRPPDVSDVAVRLATVKAPDAFERYAAAHPYGTGLDTAVSRPPDVRDTAASVALASTPDVFERYATAHPYGIGLPSGTEIVVRPPDVSDAALAVQTGSSTTQSSGFDWTDWAIGIGAGLGLMLLLGVGFVMSRQTRHPQPA